MSLDLNLFKYRAKWLKAEKRHKHLLLSREVAERLRRFSEETGVEESVIVEYALVKLWGEGGGEERGEGEEGA